jgi:undecaprenyl-diphosphatase
MIEKLINLDEQLSRKLVLPEEKKFLRKTAAFFAHSGDSWFWLAGLFILWLFSSGDVHTHSAFFAASIVLQATLILAIKFTIKRRRPEGDWGSVYRNTDPHSFPSGHAVRAVMLAALAWGLGLQPLAWILTIWAPLVSLARVSLGVHYLWDVLAGWIIGILLALGILAIKPFLYQTFTFIFFK